MSSTSDQPKKQYSIRNKYYQSKRLIWGSIVEKQAIKLQQVNTVKEVKEILAKIFNFTVDHGCSVEMILLNLYTYAIQFAKDQKFTAAQMSTFFSFMKNIHERNIESSFDQLETTYEYMQSTLLAHSINQPPHSTEIFTVVQVRKIAYYVINTYFRHIKLYKYVFTPKIRLDAEISYAGLNDRPKIKKQSIEEDAGITLAEVQPDKMKEKARQFLRIMITKLIKEKISEIKLDVNEKLVECNTLVTNRLEEAGYSAPKKSKNLSKKKK